LLPSSSFNPWTCEDGKSMYLEISMLSRILNKEQQKLLAAERQTLSALQVALSRFDTSEADLEVLRNSILQLDELFLIVIVGSSTRERAPSSARCSVKSLWKRASLRPPRRFT
jgi:hypothetical protein